MASPAAAAAVEEEENAASNWNFDCALLQDLPSLDPGGFHWSNALPPPTTSLSGEFENLFGASDCIKKQGCRKRLRSEVSTASDSKAYKEKLRRDRLNDRFQELSSVLEPGRPSKTDKVIILSDAVRLVIQLREEACKLKESCNNLQEEMSELKREKNELRDEKLKLKEEKDKLEQKLKSFSTRPSFFPHPPPIHAPFAAPSHIVGSKLIPFVGYPGVPMWQFMPPAAVDTSEDQSLRPPVA